MRPVNSMTQQQYKESQQRKDPRRQYQGKINKDLGKQFENLIDRACLFYQAVKEAEIAKTPEPMRPLEMLEEGRFIACFEKKAQPDYKGTLAAGRAVVFEAKHTTTGQMEQNKVTPEQAEALNRHYRMGALCFVLVGFSMEKFYRIPWEIWQDMKAHFGRKYVRPDDLEQYRVIMGRNRELRFLG